MRREQDISTQSYHSNKANLHVTILKHCYTDKTINCEVLSLCTALDLEITLCTAYDVVAITSKKVNK